MAEQPQAPAADEPQAPAADQPQAPAVLWRRVPWKPAQITSDDNQNRWRASSAAFNDNPDGSPMSVDIAEGQDPATSLEGYPNSSLAAVPVALLQELGLEIVRRPLPNNPHHAEIVGAKSSKTKRRLAKASTWVIPPPDDWKESQSE